MPVHVSLMRVFLCMTVFLSANPSCLQAQDSAIPPRLTLEEAIRLAVVRNPSLAAAKNQIEALQGDSLAASKRLNPAVSLQAEDFRLATNPGPFFRTQEITLRFDYEIERGGRRQLRTTAARQAVEAQRLAYQDTVRLMTLEVKRAFSRVILAKSNLEASRSLLEETDRMISLNRVRYEQGEISRSGTESGRGGKAQIPG